MHNNILRKAIKSVISTTKLNNLGKKLGFTKRKRDICGFNMVNALIASSGEENIHSLADICRKFNSLTGLSLDPKPFHNQLKKPELSELLRVVAEKALSKWINLHYHLANAKDLPFDKILLHDGSSMGIHDALKKESPGRFTTVSPAAIECHVTMDLLSNSVASISIAPDSESERHFVPDAESLSHSLFMADAGYFEKSYMKKIDEAQGYFIMRGTANINPEVLSGVRADGEPLKLAKKPKKFSQIKSKLPKRQSFELSVQWHDKRYRLVGFWISHLKRFSYVISNLPANQFSLIEIGKLYRLRWQIELLFKEFKSHNNLKKFNTRKLPIVHTLVWATLLSVTLKRFLAGHVERRFKTLISTLTATKTTHGWWHDLFEAIINNRQRRILTVLEKAGEVLRNNAKVSHPKRDRASGRHQFLLEYGF